MAPKPCPPPESASKGAKSLRRGNPWLYRTELAEPPAVKARGAVVAVVDPQGNPIGQAFYAQRSPLALRLLTRRPPPRSRWTTPSSAAAWRPRWPAARR